jgi:hypothetical protein
MATASELITALRNLKENPNDPKSVVQPYKSTADLIDAHGAQACHILLNNSISQAAAVGISIEFGGYAKDNDGVYVPYAHTRTNTIFMPHPSLGKLPIEDAMTWFLFETRNAMRAQKVCQLRRDTAKGLKTKDQFINLMGEYETRGGLEIGQMWQTIISKYRKNPSSERSTYYHGLYKSSPNWENDPQQLSSAVNGVLISKYQSGQYQGKTRRQVYDEIHYSHVINNKAYYSHPSITCTGNDLKHSIATTVLPIAIV